MIHLPATYQDSQSEQSINMETYERSETDSAFIEPSTLVLGAMNQSQLAQAELSNSGTFSALPGIVTDEMEDDIFPHMNITKVSQWLHSEAGGANLDEFNLNMYPLETTDQNSNATSTASRYCGDDSLFSPSPRVKSSTKTWLFGAHRNPKVVSIWFRN